MLRRTIIIFLSVASIATAYGWYQSYLFCNTIAGINANPIAEIHLFSQFLQPARCSWSEHLEDFNEIREMIGGWNIGTMRSPNGSLGITAWKGHCAIGWCGVVSPSVPAYRRSVSFAGFGTSDTVVWPNVTPMCRACLPERTDKPIQDKKAHFRFTLVHAPFWFIFSALAAYPAITLILWPIRRRLRKRKGFCTSCGYNLTGLPELRCPECGLQMDASDTRVS